MQPTHEQWLPVKGYEGLYEISDQGRVRSVDRYTVAINGRRTFYRGMLRKPQAQQRQGHLKVMLIRNNCPRGFYVHTLVLSAFVGPRPSGLMCRHLDGDPTNNHVSNLAWGTASENMQDLLRHGNHPQASKTHCPQGHVYDDLNTYVRPNLDSGGYRRVCRACHRDRQTVRRQRLYRERAEAV